MDTGNQDNLTRVRDEIRAFIVDNFLFGEERPFGDEDSFLGTNLVDSTGILELIQFVEQTYGITIDDEEMVPENLDSLANAALFVAKKREKAVEPSRLEEVSRVPQDSRRA